MAFNKLTDAEAERLALLLEELGEAQQAIGKILRHGYDSFNPDTSTEYQRSPTNREYLESELGDIRVVVDLMVDREDINKNAIDRKYYDKITKKKRYLHHQEQL